MYVCMYVYNEVYVCKLYVDLNVAHISKQVACVKTNHLFSANASVHNRCCMYVCMYVGEDGLMGWRRQQCLARSHDCVH